MVRGARDDAEGIRNEVVAVLAPMGLRLSATKPKVCHRDEGFDFLGSRVQRRAWRRRANKRVVYSYPSKKALASLVGKVQRLTRRRHHRTLSDLLRRLNLVLRGWCNNWFRHGVSKRTFGYLDHYAHCAGGRMAEETTPRIEHAHPGPSLPPRMGDQQREDPNVPTRPVRRRAIPIPGHQDFHTLAEHNHNNSGMNTWRAGCARSCTSASRGRAGETHRPKG